MVNELGDHKEAPNFRWRSLRRKDRKAQVFQNLRLKVLFQGHVVSWWQGLG